MTIIRTLGKSSGFFMSPTKDGMRACPTHWEQASTIQSRVRKQGQSYGVGDIEYGVETRDKCRAVGRPHSPRDGFRRDVQIGVPLYPVPTYHNQSANQHGRRGEEADNAHMLKVP